MTRSRKTDFRRRTGASREDCRIEMLTRRHHLEKFSSGEPAIDQYVQKQALRDMRKKTACVFALAEGKSVVGF